MTDDLLRALAGLHPQLQAAFESEQSEWHPENPPKTVLAGSLAIAFAAARLDQDVCKQAFSICEEALAHDHPDADALATGFLEGLQHEAGYQRFDFRTAVEFLGPKSREHCQGMDELHGARTRGL